MERNALLTFQSVLTEERGDNHGEEAAERPSFFGDLNLDRVIDAITAGWEDYNLKPYYYARLNDLSAIAYRQEIFRDLEDLRVLRGIQSFSERMRAMHTRLKKGNEAKRLDYKYPMERMFLGAVEIYCEAVENLLRDLGAADLKSRGLRAMRDYLAEYSTGASFRDLAMEARGLGADFAAVRYCLLLKDGSVTVRHYNEEDDYSVAVEGIFEKFRHDTVSRYRLDVRNWEGMNHIEAQIQDRVALLYPEVFQALDGFCTARAAYIDDKIARFDREIQFYVAYLTYVERFRRARFTFYYPQLSDTCKEIGVQNAFDIALADKLIDEKTAVVPNDFCLSGAERILVVSGPNQGGKTTFARMIGQLHYLASLGCPSPAAKRGSFCLTASSRTSNGKKTSEISAANSRMISFVSIRFWAKPPRTAS